MKEQFTAAVLREHYAPLSIETLTSETPSKGQVLVRMITSGLCGAQINEIDAVKGEDKYRPHLMGHEGYGEVIAIGEGVTKVKTGDHVVLHWRKGEGCDCFGGKYHGDHDVIGSGPVTTFAEQTIVAENRITPVQHLEEIKELYPLMGCALSTAYGIVNHNIKKTGTVLITGAGGLGLSIAFWLKVLYNITPTLLDKHENKKEYVESLGGKFISSFESIEGTRFNYVIDTSGNTDVIGTGFTKVDKQGSLILVGQPRIGTSLTLPNALSLFDGIKIYSSDGGDFVPEIDLQNIIFYVRENMHLAKKLVTHIIKLEEINNGFSMMRNGEAGRIIINFEEGA
jgi:Zn-dependent alcohol dehydrogenase